jgi:hypothetical protein
MLGGFWFRTFRVVFMLGCVALKSTFVYSYRSAEVGSTREARRAGK